MFGKKTMNYADRYHLDSLLQHCREYYETHKALKPRIEKLEKENTELKQSLKGILNYFQIDLTPDLDNCYKRSKVRKDLRKIIPLK